MAEKPKSTDESDSGETKISATRYDGPAVGETAHTSINPLQVDADQLGETIVTEVNQDLLQGNTMETVIEQLHDDRGAADGNTQATQVAPAIGASASTPASHPAHEAKYNIIKKLGKGGFAWVYLVENLDLKRLEAMKILNTELAEDEDVLERFVKEARTSALFHHQNIVTVYEVQKRGSWSHFKVDPEIMRRHREPFAFFTMSFVEGTTATDLIKKKNRIPQKDAIRIVMDTCQALEYAHSKGVVHRDIKPDNILVDGKGMGIVMDFGIAKVTDSTRQTAAGTFMGTARYVSPEQAMGKEIDARSDLYSLGIALYELATGRVPFDSDKWMTVLYQHINEAPPSPEKFFTDIDRNLRQVILKMLEKAPEDRFQTARETYDALIQIYQQLGGEDRKTRSFNDIDTRHDFIAPGTDTAVTQVGEGPPAGRTRLNESQKQKKGMPKALLIGLPLLVLAAVALYFLLPGNQAPLEPSPKTVNTPDQSNQPVVNLPKGKLLLSAFPRGKVLRITNEKGIEVPLTENTLPQTLELVEGTYTVVFSYQSQTKIKNTYVSKDVPLSRISEEFAVENERFLLEDMQ